MQVKFHAMFIAFLTLIFFSCANAGWNALNSGYAVTSDYHGIEVALGTMVTATAATTDPSVLNVTFVWKFPNETVAFEDIDVAVSSSGMRYPDENGNIVFCAQSSYEPNVEGKWGVQVFFKGPGGHLRGNGTDIIAIKATSDVVISEISIVGVAGTIAAASLSLVLLHDRRKRKLNIKA